MFNITLFTQILSKIKDYKDKPALLSYLQNMAEKHFENEITAIFQGIIKTIIDQDLSAELERLK